MHRKSSVRALVMRYAAQILVTLSVSFGPFAAGLGKGYSSPALSELQSTVDVIDDQQVQQQGWMGRRTFSVSPQEGSWIASLSLLGALFGGPFGGWAVRYGRRRVLRAVAIPFAICWLSTVLAQNVSMMYVTAFTCGFFSAIIVLATNIYVSEIASSDIRGALSAVTKVASDVGLLVGFGLGSYLDWRRLAMVAAAAPLTLLVASFFVPETPGFLAMCGRSEMQVADCLQWLRGEATDITQELAATMQATTSAASSSKERRVTGLHNRRFVRPLLVTCGAMLFYRLSGSHAFSFYAVPILKSAFTELDPHAAAIAVVVVQIVAAIASGLLVDTVGRLPLLVVSNIFMSLALAGFGTVLFYSGDGGLTWLADWIPLMCVLTFAVAFSIGVGPITPLLITELYPLEYRGVGGACTALFGYACAFVNVKTFADFESLLGLHGAFWMYAVIALLGLAFVLVFVPETRGRRLDELHTQQEPGSPEQP